MPGEMHKKMGLVSYNSLPEWQKVWWNFSLDDTTGIYNKKFKSKEKKISQYCLIVDDLWNKWKKKEYKKYLLFKEKSIPHGPVDRNFNQVWVTKEEHNQYNFFLVLKYYTERFIEALKNEDFDISVVFAGILAHIIQDSCWPSHSISNTKFYEFYPCSSRIPHFHTIIDEVNVSPEKCKPILLGVSVEEIAFRLWAMVENHILWCKNNLFKILDAAYKGKDKLLGKLMQPSCDKAVEIVSSLWYSSICVATGKYKEDEKENLKEISLTKLIPYFSHPGGKYPFIIKNHSVVDGKFKPLYIKENGKIKKVKQGLGLTSFVSAKYLIESSVFKRFKCKVGFSPVFKDEQNKNTKVKFIIETDKEINEEYVSDLNYRNTKKVYET